MKVIVASLALILLSSTFASAQNTQYIPQIADGAGWVTSVAVSNPAAPGTAVASGTVTFTKDDGTAFNLLLTDGVKSLIPVSNGSVSFQIAGGQTKLFVSTGLGSTITTGYATVTSNLTVVTGAIFVELNATGTTQIAAAGVAAVTPLTQQGTIANEYGADTGVAIANPGSTTANVSFQLLDLNGATALPAVTRPIAAKNHTSFFISQLFTNLPANFLGTLRITSDVGVVTTALLFNSNGTFATIPVFPLQ